MRRPALAAVVAVVILALAYVVIPDSAGQSSPPRAAALVEVGVAPTVPTPAGDADVAAQVAIAEEQAAADRAGWIAGVEEAERQAQAARARAAAGSQGSPGYHPGTTDDGECTGFAIPSYIIQRESGGNPSAYNPSGAYGCAQTLLSHYSRGSCQGLDPYTIQGQRDCVDILSAGGTNLNPWAQTR